MKFGTKVFAWVLCDVLWCSFVGVGVHTSVSVCGVCLCVCVCVCVCVCPCVRAYVCLINSSNQ